MTSGTTVFDNIIQAHTGAYNTPSIIFGTDTDTGLYGSVSNTLGFTSGGNVKLSVSSSDTHISGVNDILAWYNFTDSINLGNDHINSLDGIAVGSNLGTVTFSGRDNVLNLTDNPSSGVPTEYINLTSQISSFSSLTNFSISVWAYLPSTPTSTEAIVSLSDKDKADEELRIIFEGSAGSPAGEITWQYRDNGSSATTFNINTNLDDSGSWKHIYCTVGANGAELYVNGVSQGTDSATTSPNDFSVNSMYIGCNDDSGASLQWSFSGYIQDLIMFNRQLRVDEIQALYNNDGDTFDINSSTIFNYPVTVQNNITSRSIHLDNQLTSPSLGFGCFENYVLDSEDLTNWDILNTSCTVVANTVIAPDGSTTASEITVSGTPNQQLLRENSIGIAANTEYTISYWAKKLDPFTTSTDIQWDIGDGVVSSSISFTNSWTRYSSTVSSDASGDFIDMIFTSTPVNGDKFSVWGIQLSLGNVGLTPYYKTSGANLTTPSYGTVANSMYVQDFSMTNNFLMKDVTYIDFDHTDRGNWLIGKDFVSTGDTNGVPILTGERIQMKTPAVTTQGFQFLNTSDFPIFEIAGGGSPNIGVKIHYDGAAALGGNAPLHVIGGIWSGDDCIVEDGNLTIHDTNTDAFVVQDTNSLDNFVIDTSGRIITIGGNNDSANKFIRFNGGDSPGGAEHYISSRWTDGDTRAQIGFQFRYSARPPTSSIHSLIEIISNDTIGEEINGLGSEIVGAISSAGHIRGGTGTVSAPSFSFVADTNTGMYSVSSDTIGFATNSTQRMTIGTQVLAMDGSNSTPSYSFTDGTNTGMFYDDANNDLEFTVEGTNTMTFTSTITVSRVDFIPDNNATRSFGTNSTRWDTIYGGGYAGTVTSEGSSTTLDEGDFAVRCTAAITITVPAASSHSGRIYHIIHDISAGGTVTIARTGSDTFDDGSTTSLTLTTRYDHSQLLSDGSSIWYLI